MSSLLALLFAAACPLGMVAMMAGPMLLHRFTRRARRADPAVRPGSGFPGGI